MPTYAYPSAAELRQLEQDKLPVLTADDPIFEIFPFEEADEDLLLWEQTDNFVGLQQVRGLNGEPGRVQLVGAKSYMMRPGYYGEFIQLDEEKLTRRRQLGTFGAPIRLDDLVVQAQDQLLNRRLDRVKTIAWTLATTGTFSIANPAGGVLHTDTFPIQSYTAGVAWATAATATPLANFRAVKLLARGHSVSFGNQAIAYMNQVTFNNLIGNTNSADLAGKRTSGLATVMTLAEVNAVLAGEDLPQIRIYDEGYLNDAGTFVPYIANAKVFVRGRRPGGQRIAAYRMTRNANNPAMEPGSYTLTYESPKPPKVVEVHDGHNGGPVVYHPSAMVMMSV